MLHRIHTDPFLNIIDITRLSEDDVFPPAVYAINTGSLPFVISEG